MHIKLQEIDLYRYRAEGAVLTLSQKQIAQPVPSSALQSPDHTQQRIEG